MVRAMILQFVAALAMLRMYFLGTWCTGVVRHRRQLELSFVAQMSCGQLPPLTAVPLRAQFETDSTAKRRRWQPSRKRANFSPQRTLCLPEKTQCLVQILTFKSHPWCSSSNAICQQRLANHNQDRNFSALPYSSLLYSPLLYSALLLPLLFFFLVFSILPLLYLCSTSTQVPIGHNDLWASENVTS